jgi:peptidoglycan hydrolase CwlO-like protein
MDDTLFAPRTDAEYEAIIEQMLREMQHLNQKMQEDQAEIERLKAETRILKAETEAIKARTQARLNSLMEMVVA